MIGEAGAAISRPMRRLSALSRSQVIYLVAVPLALLVFNATARWSINLDLTLGQVLAISLLLHAIPWWALLLVMWPLHRLLGPLKVPLWGLTTIATLLTGILLHSYIKFCFALIALLAPSFLQAKAGVQYGFTLPYVLLFIKCALPTVITTIVCIEVCEKILCLGWWQPRPTAAQRSPVLGEGVASHPVTPPAAIIAPAKAALPVRASFLRHSKLPETAIVLALQAEDHYLRVYSDAGSDLIRYRFTDALTELNDPNGLRVHRSWWVNSNFASHFTASGKVAEIGLNTGLNVPVSLRYRSAVERALGAPKVRAPCKRPLPRAAGG